MFRLIGKGDNFHIVVDHPQMGSVPVATVRGDVAEEVERAQKLVDLANMNDTPTTGLLENDIQTAQVLAGERAVLANLTRLGL